MNVQTWEHENVCFDGHVGNLRRNVQNYETVFNDHEPISNEETTDWLLRGKHD